MSESREDANFKHFYCILIQTLKLSLSFLAILMAKFFPYFITNRILYKFVNVKRMSNRLKSIKFNNVHRSSTKCLIVYAREKLENVVV